MVQDCCQKVGPLQKLGAFGVTLTAAQKKILMAVAFCLTGLSWILTIVAMVGSSTDNDVVKNCAWTYQEYQGMDIYYGTYRAVAEGYGTTTGVEYSDCTDDACNDCETAGITATNCAVLTFILLFFFAAFSALRMVNKFDCVTVKTTFIVLSLINVLIMIIGMGSWNDQCVESHIKNGGKLKIHFSFLFVFLASLLIALPSLFFPHFDSIQT